MKRRRSTYLLVLLAALLVGAVAVGCGGGDDGGTAGSPAPSADPAPPASPPGDTGEDDENDDAAPSAGRGDGETFQVEDAGSVTLRAENDRLVLVSVHPASGWTHRVTEEERDEVEIDFLRDGRKVYEFEAELDDGRIAAKIDREG